MSENSSSESTITTPLGSVAWKGKRMSEFIAILCLCLLFLLSYVLWEHKAEAKTDSLNLAAVIQQMAAAQTAMVQATREQTCILRFDQKERQVNADFCKQISR